MNTMIRLMFLILLSTGAFGCSDHGNSADDFMSRSVNVNGIIYQYRVSLPKDRDPNKKLAVMLYLHGSGSRGDDNLAQVDGFASAIAPIKDKIDFIIVIPQCRKETFWASAEMAKYALASLDNSVKEFNGDEGRLYLAGFSLGGYGTWQIAAANPGKFAALVPVAGGVVGERPIQPEDRASIIPEVGTMLDSDEPYKAIATAIGQTPVWVFHGAADDAVPVEFSREMVQTLRKLENTRVKYTEFQNEGHLIFGKSFSEPGFLEWLSDQKLWGSFGRGFSRDVRLADGTIRKLDINRNGIFLDYAPIKGSTSFDAVYPISETVDCWDPPTENGRTGHFFLFGTFMANGICGMSKYAFVHTDRNGNVRVSEEIRRRAWEILPPKFI